MKIDNLLIASAASAAAAALAAGTAPIVTAAGVASVALLSVRNSLNSPATSFSQTALTAFYALSNFGTAEGMVNGRLPANPDANIAVPALRCGTIELCTGFRLNQHQIMTAKHCVRNIDTGKHKNCSVADENGQRIYPSKIDRHPKLDIALLTFDAPLPGKNVCAPPWMSPENYKKTVRGGTDVGNSACGGVGSIIVAGRGKKELSAKSCNQPSKDLSVGRFRRTVGSAASSRVGIQTQHYRGTTETPQASSNSGDSGGLAMMCNAQTRKFETVGVHSLGHDRGHHNDEVEFNNKKSGFAAVSKEKASLRWVTSKAKPCNGTALTGKDFISPNLAPKPKPASISTCVSVRLIKKRGQDKLIVNNGCKCAVELEVGQRRKIKKIISTKHDAQFPLFKAKRGIKAKYFELGKNEHQYEALNLLGIVE